MRELPALHVRAENAPARRRDDVARVNRRLSEAEGVGEREIVLGRGLRCAEKRGAFFGRAIAGMLCGFAFGGARCARGSCRDCSGCGGTDEAAPVELNGHVYSLARMKRTNEHESHSRCLRHFLLSTSAYLAIAQAYYFVFSFVIPIGNSALIK